MTLEFAKEMYKQILEAYENKVLDKNATVYENSKLCDNDSKFFESFQNTILNDSEEFKDKIKDTKNICPENYTNTTSELKDLGDSVFYGYQQFDYYLMTIKNKSKEVFQEYVEKFNTIHEEYLSCSKNVASKKVEVENAQTAMNIYQRAVNNAIDLQEKKINQAQLSGARRTRDLKLQQLATELQNLRSYLDQMLELLDKGLQKI